MAGQKSAAAYTAVQSTLARADTVRLAAGSESAGPAVEGGPRYETLKPLGEGGMGRVDLARDRDLLREVAVKLLRPELLADPAMLDQFLWEARVTAHLDHPNIVPVHDVGREGDGVFFTMKLVRGATLESLLERSGGEMARNRRLRVFLQICNAVAFAHARGVLHRDLKPSNVMVGEFGEVLVTDWGLAQPLDTDAGRAIAKLMPPSLAMLSAGTPAYMSPEQARGENLDERSDVYSLGVILYEIVALARAFDAESAPALLAKVLKGDAPKLATIAPALPHSLVVVVEKAMALDREDRYASVTALADDVEKVLDGRTPSAEHVSMARRFARFYMTRDPGLARLRVVDVDVLTASTFLMGIGAAEVIRFGPTSWWWAAIVAGVVVSIPPMLRWFKPRRGED